MSLIFETKTAGQMEVGGGGMAPLLFLSPVARPLVLFV